MPYSSFYSGMQGESTVRVIAHNSRLLVCFSHLSVLSASLPHVWYMNLWDFFVFCVALSSSLFSAFHSFLSQWVKNPQWNHLLNFTPQYPSVCLSHSASLRPPVLSICGSAWHSERSTARDKAAHKVLRRYVGWWHMQAQSVTNAFGWSAGPQGTLFHYSIGTWKQLPKEPFEGEKFYQSQPVLLPAHPKILNRTFKTRWSSLCLCVIMLFMWFTWLSWAGQLRGFGERKEKPQWKKHLEISVSLD